MKIHFMIVFAAIFLRPPIVFAEDWDAIFRGATRDDKAIRQQAEQRLRILLDDLAQQPLSKLNPEVSLIAAELRSFDKAVRAKAASFLGAISMIRMDSRVALEPAIPLLLVGLSDDDSEVRRASVLAIGNLKPAIPETAIGPFALALRDDNPETVRVAAAGLATFCTSSPTAVGELHRLLFDVSKVRKQTALLVVGWAGCDNLELLRGVEFALQEKDEDIVLAAIRSAAKLGPKAMPIRSTLEFLARGSDFRIAEAAIDALRNGP